MKKNNFGFTIIELMIAITILSIILLMSTAVLVGVGNLFYKGANMSNVQDANRNIIQDVTATVQFSGSQFKTASYNYGKYTVTAYCFGSTRYSFVTGFPSGWSHVVWKDSMTNQNACSPLDIAQAVPTCNGNTACSPSQNGSGIDLAGYDMHLASFQIRQYNSQLYGISVGLVVGFKDMFKEIGGNPVLVNGDNYICNTSSGQQYCATSFLDTFATERLGS